MWPSTLADWLRKVVEVEGPVHFDVATKRVASAAGVQRRGRRIQEAFKEALADAKRSRKLALGKKGFLCLPGSVVAEVRDRSELDTLERSIEYVSPEELDLAI